MHNDQLKLSEIETIWNEKISKPLSFTVDQSLYGVTACLLYQMTHQQIYLDYADSLYHWLLAEDTDFCIPYTPGNLRLIDGIGMYNPFLIEYSFTTGNREAYSLAVNQIEEFAQYGLDESTGMPAHGYRIDPPRIKIGSANWGRGCSWFAIGLLGIDKADLNTEACRKVRSFETTLFELYKESASFKQYIGTWGNDDLSVILPISYYLHQKGIITLSSQDIIMFSKYCHDGLMYNSSGDTERENVYNRYFGPYPLSQAMMMFLCLEFEK